MNRSAAIASVATYLEGFFSDTEAFRGQQLRGGGPVAEFEATLAERCGFPFCVATCNATSALMGLGLAFRRTHTEVWVSNEHWGGTASALRSVGCRVRNFDGSDPSGSPGSSVGILITGPRTERPDGLENWLWVEDSSRLPGLTHSTGCLSPADFQVLSFGPGKPLCLGEGGAILCRERKHHRRLVRLTQHPERVRSEFGIASGIPTECVNGRIHPLAALIGSEILARGNELS